ncbi:G kinase-anchoring protein 1-like isoform X2 [Halichondria panicea]|uniref:G kinase-anchoring protein 1-like isoform X2 n=1 Tax=Halichondria panicea TaxID=6063 RepID=UPI00312BC89A
MMSGIKGGISVQKSKFSVLTIDSLSEDSDSDSAITSDWTQVKAIGIGKQKGKGKQGETLLPGKDGERPLSKNAKKRARKRKQRNISESSDGKPAESATLLPGNLSWEQETRMRSQAAADQEFQKDMEKAILMSKSDAQDHTKLLEESHLAERVAITESLSSNKLPTKTSGKKGVTLSLQEFQRGDTADNQKSLSTKTKPQVSDILDPLPLTPTTPTDNFFDRLSVSVAKEVGKEHSKQAPATNKQDANSSEDLPRIAQLKDELEKRDTVIEKLRKHNELFKKALREAKERNQSLYKILSQGEFSTKTQLIEQVEQLTTVKNELTDEVESLHISLEQEKSKNKGLKLELAKLMGGSVKASRTNSSS